MPKVPIFMPQLGESIAEATVVNLLVEVGATVQADQDVIEVETQKATMSVTTLCPGTLIELRAEAGKTYPVGHILGLIEASDQQVEAYGVEVLGSQDNSLEGQQDSGEQQQKPADEQQPSEKNLHFADNNDPAPPSAEPEPGSVQPHVRGLTVPAHAKGASYISPRLKAKMEELGLRGADLANIAGSGRGGRVTVEDLERFLDYIAQYPSHEASHMRRAVADSMQRSWSRPLATVGLAVRMQPLLDHRRASEQKPGVTLYAMRALALALKEFPAAAGHLLGENIFTPKQIDIGFAVEVPDGVLVPKLRALEQRSLAELSEDYRSVLEKAQQRQLSEEDQRGGIATVTNIGTFGLRWGTPIPPPTESLTMALCAAERVPRWQESTSSFEPSLEAELCLSFDHRVIDGGAGGRVLMRIRELMEQPEQL